jgi:hypothetical protein
MGLAAIMYIVRKMASSTDQAALLPPAAIFNRYFVNHPVWRVRECYLGRQDAAELTVMPEFGEEFAALLSDIRDHINHTYNVSNIG